MPTRFYYQEVVSHSGLNKYRIVKAESKYELNQKVAALERQWDEQWRKIVEREKQKKAREDQRISDEESEAYAIETTKQAQDLQNSLDRILLNSLYPKDLDKNELKDFSEYPEQQPTCPVEKEIPPAPQRSDAKYNPKPSLITKLSKKKTAESIHLHDIEFEKDLEIWSREKSKTDESNQLARMQYEAEKREWEEKRNSFVEAQQKRNDAVDLLFENCQKGEPTSVEHYFKYLLDKAPVPFSYNRAAELEYNQESKRLIVDIMLPVIDDLPKLKALSYIKSRKEYKESFYPDSYIKKKYDSVIYQIVLQTLNTIFTVGSKYSLPDSIVVNGKVDTIDSATGQRIEPYILSVTVDRTSFEAINLEAVDPKAWFRSAKGTAAASLANTTPVAPLVSISHEDNRFVEGYEVVKNLDEGINLAAIDWQDFENLVREIFEVEFSANGGEVKITQASRDGGVDAIAFDPDPIRGGKIVIQAKRYTNVVGVSAVRDLYGTVMNEGATKGILVTTSYYGNDAYSFAQGKPLTLMDGANLLYLLEKHGHKAKIDLKEAKEMLRGQS